MRCYGWRQGQTRIGIPASRLPVIPIEKISLHLVKTNHTRTPCTIWQGTVTDNGSGQIYGIVPHGQRAIGFSRYAHRRAYEDAFGKLFRNAHVHHLCGETLCVNLDHLVLLSDKAHAKIHHAKKRTCKHGHMWTAETLTWQNGRRLCRKCRNARMREWGKTHRDARISGQKESRVWSTVTSETSSDAGRRIR